MSSSYNTNNIILILSNSLDGLYSFRKELINQLVDNGNEILISSPDGLHRAYFEKRKIKIELCKIDRRRFSIWKDYRLYKEYKNLVIKNKPSLILTYTVKPNIYGNLIGTRFNIPCISTITGLGSSLQSNNLKSFLILLMYRIALSKRTFLFFQNETNMLYFKNQSLLKGEYSLVNGSGVNIQEFQIFEYPEEKDELSLLYIGRIMFDKGSRELLLAVEQLNNIGIKINLVILGYCESDMREIFERFRNKHFIAFHEEVKDVQPFIKECHCLINPSYHEGMSNVVLEAAACGRPSLVSDIAGCREIIDHGRSGMLFIPRCIESLKSAILEFATLSNKVKKNMGIEARLKIEKEFDRKDIVKKYLNAINSNRNGVVNEPL